MLFGPSIDRKTDDDELPLSFDFAIFSFQICIEVYQFLHINKLLYV